jgi:N-acetylglucosaminyldiphosphoundecaprenol N-acetyl-beta-D-mannosaminyltransferase
MATWAREMEGSPATESARYAAPPSGVRGRLKLGGVLIDQVDLVEAGRRIEGFLRTGRPHQIVTVNLDFLSIAHYNDRFREVLNRSDLAVADGMPLVWASHLRGEPLPERVTGGSLVAECCRLAAASGEGVFLLGAGPGVASVAGATLAARFPGLRIVGAYSPPMGPLSRRQNARILNMVRSARPGFLFVALGAPRQDLWIAEHMDYLGVPVAMGVGSVLDVIAGVVNRAPPWMQQVGLEWTYRLLHEPRRLWRRYLLNDTGMLGRLILDGLRRVPADRGQTVAVPT